jgi:hypothetical protein
LILVLSATRRYVRPLELNDREDISSRPDNKDPTPYH